MESVFQMIYIKYYKNNYQLRENIYKYILDNRLVFRIYKETKIFISILMGLEQTCFPILDN